AADIDTDEYSDAIPLPTKRPAGKPPAKPPRHDPFATYIPGASAKPAEMRRRHWGLVLFFLMMVIFPAVVHSWYLYTRAADQYESDVGFGSRTEDAPSTFAFLGVLSGSGASSSSDMDILNQFIGSQELVARIDKKLDLRSIFSKPANDPLFTFPKDGSIEDLVGYWQKMVLPNYDSGTGLMTLRIFAFDPHDAQNIASAVLDESTSIINELSTTAQTDATKYSAETLANAEKRMAESQRVLTAYRIKNHIVDPQAQLAGASQVVNTLVQQLGAAQIDRDMLVGTLPDSDPRIAQLNRRIEVIQKRMDEENSKVGGLADTTSPGYAELVVGYQNLQMEQDFAQKAYLTALSAYDQAVNDAQHKTRYLTTFLSPTLAESTTAPNRPLRVFLTLLAGFLAWASIVMIYYALRDRR
ncbi:MAG: sugar transporter, partial [Candidatus Saccharibacteria bacterium]|nr:sugar transporter [Pseudorhodobacter sp.]